MENLMDKMCYRSKRGRGTSFKGGIVGGANKVPHQQEMKAMTLPLG